MTQCRNTSEFSLLIAATVVDLVRVALSLVPHFAKKDRFDSSAQRNKWSIWHRNWALLHYVTLWPFFEFFVIWGQKVLPIVPVAAEIIVMWLSIQILCVILLLVSACTASNYRKTFFVTQVMEIASMIAFMSERLMLGGVRIELFVVLAVLLCCLVEVFTTPDMIFATPHHLFSEHNVFRKLPPQNDVGDEMKSHALAEASIERRVNSLLQIISEADIKTMDADDMRNLLKQCKTNIESMSDVQQVSTPRSQVSSSVTDYLSTPTLPEIQMPERSNTLPLGLGERYNRRRQMKEEPEC